MKSNFIVFMMSIFLLSCTPNTQHTIQELPSGKEIKLISVGKMYFTKDDPALMLKYQTDINIDNTDSLRREAEEIWPVFRVDVEKSGLNSAVITATSQPTTKYFFFHTSRSFNFVVTKKDNGTWDFKAWGKDYSGASQALAEQHLKSLMKNNFTKATEALHFPSHYTTTELNKDLKGISNALQLIIGELGAIEAYTPSEQTDTYQFVHLSSATIDYWNKHPIFNNLIYNVTYSKRGKGYVIIGFSIIDGKHVISTVRYALSNSKPESKEIMDQIITRLMQEINST